MQRAEDVNEVAAFVAAADELHLGRAAVVLGVPRTTLSARLRRLEARVGLCLVDRRHRCRIALTQAGAALLPVARRLVGAADDLADAALEVREGRRGVVRIALLSPPDAEMDGLVDGLRGVHEGWAVETVEMDTRAAGRAMAVGAVECALGRGVPPPRTTPGFLDPRPNRLEQTDSLTIGSQGSPGLTVAWRLAWAFPDGVDRDRLSLPWNGDANARPFGATPDAAARASPHATHLIRAAWLARQAGLERRFPRRAAARRAEAGRRAAIEQESRLRRRDAAEHGHEEALRRAAERGREQERRVLRERMRRAVAAGEVGLFLWVAWLAAEGPDAPLPEP